MYSQRRGLLLVFAAVLMSLMSTAARAKDQKSIHVVFTGGVEGRLEPSG